MWWELVLWKLHKLARRETVEQPGAGSSACVQAWEMRERKITVN